MNVIPASEEEKLMAREFYSQGKDETTLEVTEFAEGVPAGNSLAKTDVFKQALAEAVYRMRTQKEFAVPAEKYSQQYQSEIDERLLNIVKRYSCSPDEAVVKLIEF